MNHQPVTQEEIKAFLSNPALVFLHAEGTNDATKRSYAWYAITLSRTDKKASIYKSRKKALKKLHDVLVFEHASYLARPGQ